MQTRLGNLVSLVLRGREIPLLPKERKTFFFSFCKILISLVLCVYVKFSLKKIVGIDRPWLPGSRLGSMVLRFVYSLGLIKSGLERGRERQGGAVTKT